MNDPQAEFIRVLRNALAEYHPDWRVNPPGVSAKTLENWLAGKSVRASAFYAFLNASRIPADAQAMLRQSFLAREQVASAEEAGEPVAVGTASAPASSIGRPRHVLWTAVALITGLLVMTGFIASAAQTPTPVPLTNLNWAPQERIINGIPMVLVPAEGQTATIGYAQGRDNELPVHEVTLGENFWIARTEVTNEQFGSLPEEACNLNQLTKTDLIVPNEPDFPRTCVTWEEAAAFCESVGMRLPTEVEWEYAARGPEAWLYPWGNEADPTRAIVRTSVTPEENREMAPAGTTRQDVSWVGAYDMAGSLREWTSTIYDESPERSFIYPYVADDGRESPVNLGEPDAPGRTARVVRGGNFDVFIDRSRSSYRVNEWFNFRFNYYGFRCAISESALAALEAQATEES